MASFEDLAADSVTPQTLSQAILQAFAQQENNFASATSSPEHGYHHHFKLTASASRPCEPLPMAAENQPGAGKRRSTAPTSPNGLHTFLTRVVTANNHFFEESDAEEDHNSNSYAAENVSHEPTIVTTGAEPTRTSPTAVNSNHSSPQSIVVDDRASPFRPWEGLPSPMPDGKRAKRTQPASAPVTKTHFNPPWRCKTAVPSYVSSVETRQYSPQPLSYHANSVDVIVVADRQPCRATFDITDSNHCVERAIACAVGRTPGTFGLKDEYGSVALSARILHNRKGPFLLVDFGSNTSPPSFHHTPRQTTTTTTPAVASTQLSPDANQTFSSDQILQDLLLPPHQLPATAPADLDRHFDFSLDHPSNLFSPSNQITPDAKRVKVLPPTEDRLARLDAQTAEGGQLPPHLVDNLRHESPTLSRFVAEEQSGIRSVGVLSLEEASTVLSAIDRRLNIIGLKSQREKAAFLTAIGAKISQQHYSTLLKAIKDQRWSGGVRASYTVRKLQAAVLDPTESDWARNRDLVPHVRAQQQFRRQMARAAARLSKPGQSSQDGCNPVQTAIARPDDGDVDLSL
eukprot:TRINITY_DN24745_c0_g1_i1.p1 TRINITY_DN24745_c0_g1~~TRINITY_DN24745_c0_g1_i1.p1  ORF type:complete len:572 (+),score=108.27 TRINITY_DN24745_c0_g1_i1:107-1822(+)